MKPNLHMVLHDALVEIDGQKIEIPAEASRRTDVQFVKFLERVVYLVGHKRLDFKDYIQNYPNKSVNTFRDTRFEALLKACCGFTTWTDSSWIIAKVENAEELSVSRRMSGLRVRISREMIDGEITHPEIGTPVNLRNSCFRPNFSIGYFFIISAMGAPAFGEQLARLYLNCTASGACRTLLDLSRYAVEQGLKFQAKFRNDPADYGSSDSGVIYLSTEDLPAHREGLVEILRAHERLFVPKTSCFATRLLPGVGLGIETRNRGGAHKSFGEVESAAFVKNFLAQTQLVA
jgi:hypothetical protein